MKTETNPVCTKKRMKTEDLPCLLQPAYVLCSSYGLPLVVHVDENQQANALTTWTWPSSSSSVKFWRTICQHIVVSGGMWRHRAPFQSSSSHFSAFIVPFTSGSNILYSCFLCANSHSGDRGVNDNDFRMKGFLVAYLSLQAALRYCGDTFSEFLSELTIRMDNRTRDSTFEETVANDDWWEDFLTGHPIFDKLETFQNQYLQQWIVGEKLTRIEEELLSPFYKHIEEARVTLELQGAVQMRCLLYHFCSSSTDSPLLTPLFHSSLVRLEEGLRFDDISAGLADKIKSMVSMLGSHSNVRMLAFITSYTSPMFSSNPERHLLGVISAVTDELFVLLLIEVAGSHLASFVHQTVLIDPAAQATGKWSYHNVDTQKIAPSVKTWVEKACQALRLSCHIEANTE